MPEFSDTGVWVDLKTNEVVTEQPEEGRQLVPKGGVIDDNVKLNIEQAKVAAAGGGPVGDVSTSTLHTSPPQESATADEDKTPRKRASK